MRIDGYAPIRDYAVIGDGRTCALVAPRRLDRLALPAERRLAARVRPDPGRASAAAASSSRPDGAVRGRAALPRRARTCSRRRSAPPPGAVRVTDALTLTAASRLTPLRELVRHVDGARRPVSTALALRAAVRLRRGASRTADAATAGRSSPRGGRRARARAWDAGEPRPTAGDRGTFVVEAGERALLALAHAHGEPLVLPARADAERALEQHRRVLARSGARGSTYDGPWRGRSRAERARPQAARRSRPRARSSPRRRRRSRSASAATATGTTASRGCATGRYTLRRPARASATSEEARAFFWWLMHASRLDAARAAASSTASTAASASTSRSSPLAGYRGSRARARSATAPPTSSSSTSYGVAARRRVALLVDRPGSTRPRHGRRRSPRLADFVADGLAPAGLRDLGVARRAACTTSQSKAMCWMALDRAAKLAEAGVVPDRRDRWRRGGRRDPRVRRERRLGRELAQLRPRPELHDELDASLLTLALLAYADAADERMRGDGRGASGASSPTARSSTASAARTGSRTTRARSSRARSGSSTRSPVPAAATRRRR